MPKREHKDQVFDGAQLVEEESRAETDREYVVRVTRETRAPTQVQKFSLLLQDWDNDDGSANLFSHLSPRERDFLQEVARHLLLNAIDNSQEESQLLETVAAPNFKKRNL